MSRHCLSTLLFALAALSGCERRGTANPELVAQLGAHAFDDAHGGVRARQLRAIDDRIDRVFAGELGLCLQHEMQLQGDRSLQAAFTVQFTVEPTGETHDAQLLAIGLSKRDAEGHDVAGLPATELGHCIVAAVDAWRFDPAPEVQLVDTYEGELTETL